MLVQVCLILLAMQQPDILPPAETEWLDDPNTLATLFTEWDEERSWEPYLSVLVENWLLTTRVRNYPKYIDGTWYDSWTAPYSWVGDLNHDDIVNLEDLAILAKFFKGRFKYTLPISISPIKASRSKLEVLAIFAEMLFMAEGNEE